MILQGLLKWASFLTSSGLRFLCLENEGKLLEPGSGLDLVEGNGLPNFARPYGDDTVLYIARISFVELFWIHKWRLR